MRAPGSGHGPRLDVVVLAWNGQSWLPHCLDALLAQRIDEPFRVHVVDNASTDGTVALLRRHYPQVHLVQSERNLGFAGGNNLALEQLDGEYVALLNQDAVPDPGWLAALTQALDTDPGVAAVTGKIRLADPVQPPLLNSAGGWVDRLGHGLDRGFGRPDDGRYDQPEEVFYAPATACLLRADAVREVGLLDASFFLYYEDVDLCWRLRLAGWRIGYAPAATALHAHSASAVSGSSLHVFHDARNRLLTLVKDAPAGTAVLATLLLPRAAAGFALRGDRGRAWDVLRGWLDLLRRLPALLVARRRVTRGARVSRAAVERDRRRLEPAR